MVQFVSLILILITLYWVSMLEYIPSTKIRSNTEEALFGIPGASTEINNSLRFNPIIEICIGFLLEVYQYYCGENNLTM